MKKGVVRLLPVIAAAGALLVFGVVQAGAFNIVEAVFHPAQDGRTGITQLGGPLTGLNRGTSARNLAAEDETETPEVSTTPGSTEVESSETPEATHLPEMTETPEPTEVEETETPENTEVPEMSKTPVVSGTPLSTEVSTGTPVAGLVVFIIGPVKNITDTAWQVRNVMITVDAGTQYFGNPVVGDVVRVLARLNPDGSYLALDIILQARKGGGHFIPVTPTPLPPTVVPSMTATPVTPTLEPSMTNTPLPLTPTP